MVILTNYPQSKKYKPDIALVNLRVLVTFSKANQDQSLHGWGACYCLLTITVKGAECWHKMRFCSIFVDDVYGRHSLQILKHTEVLGGSLLVLVVSLTYYIYIYLVMISHFLSI